MFCTDGGLSIRSSAEYIWSRTLDASIQRENVRFGHCGGASIASSRQCQVRSKFVDILVRRITCFFVPNTVDRPTTRFRDESVC